MASSQTTSTSAGADAFIPDYRLAPENLFPAAVTDVEACYRRFCDVSRGRRRDQQLGVVVLALYLDVMKFFIPEFGGRLAGKIVVDPSNPFGPDGKGGIERTFAVTTFYET